MCGCNSSSNSAKGNVIPGKATNVVDRSQFPEPKAWTPPITNLPSEIVDAASFLLSLGFADPRLGTFSIVYDKRDLALGMGHSEGSPAWVLPQESGEPLRAFGFDGLVREVSRVNKPANLLNEARRAAEIGPVPSVGVNYRIGGIVAILLLAGESDLAERIFADSKADPKSPYFVTIVSAYIRNVNLEAYWTFGRGDDRRALTLALHFKTIKDRTEREAKAYFNKETVNRAHGPKNEFSWHTYSDIDELIAEARHRLRNSKPSLNYDSLGTMDAETTVKLVIADLANAVIQDSGFSRTIDRKYALALKPHRAFAALRNC
jgi:hypothetical protein